MFRVLIAIAVLAAPARAQTVDLPHGNIALSRKGGVVSIQVQTAPLICGETVRQPVVAIRCETLIISFEIGGLCAAAKTGTLAYLTPKGTIVDTTDIPLPQPGWAPQVQNWFQYHLLIVPAGDPAKPEKNAVFDIRDLPVAVYANRSACGF